jgi:serine protease Do
MLEDATEKHHSLIERDAQTRRRAILLSTAACALACGVIIGAALSGRRLARASDTTTRELSSVFVEIARQVEPSVVNIATVSRPGDRSARVLPENHPGLDLLPFGGRERGARRGTGSGVIIDPQGYILTNHHVVEGADRIRVKLFDGTELAAKLIGSDGESDLAVVKVDYKTPLPPARLGDSDKVRVGDWVLAIGSPFGLDQTVTAGIISAKDREASELSSNSRSHYLQTDAAINRGNSGGPLINLAGEVIGINTAIATGTGDYNGIGFAFPASEAIVIYNQLVKQGIVERGFLGVVPERVTPQIAKIYGLPAARGAIISNVSETMDVSDKVEPTPAAKAGLRRHDIITEYRGERVKDERDFIRRVASTPIGASVTIKFYRDGKELTATAVIARRLDARQSGSAEAAASPEKAEKAEHQAIGINIALLTPQQAKEYKLDDVRGVIIMQVEPGSVAEDADLRSKDVIEMINREPVANIEQFQRALERIKSGDPVVLQVVFNSRQLGGVSRRFVSFNKP